MVSIYASAIKDDLSNSPINEIDWAAQKKSQSQAQSSTTKSNRELFGGQSSTTTTISTKAKIWSPYPIYDSALI